ncbi:hypothetical protein BGLA2_860020 [Burkholderia gladioli]|nr:hypothetical protein BGLA2_860020 [Burkholderia gladioli]
MLNLHLRTNKAFYEFDIKTIDF